MIKDLKRYLKENSNGTYEETKDILSRLKNEKQAYKLRSYKKKFIIFKPGKDFEDNFLFSLVINKDPYSMMIGEEYEKMRKDITANIFINNNFCKVLNMDPNDENGNYYSDVDCETYNSLCHKLSFYYMNYPAIEIR